MREKSIVPSFCDTWSQLPGNVAGGDRDSWQPAEDFSRVWLKKSVPDCDLFYVKSGTQSLEMAIMALDLPTGSEVIIPSFGFVSLANAVAINGHKCVFVDCESETLNFSFLELQRAVTAKTKAIITINYGGVPCDYQRLLPFCEERGIYVVEDNAHGLLASHKGRPLGTFGDISTFSFDSQKIITCFEGGAIAVRDTKLWERLNLIADVGTDRRAFIEGKVPFYEWKALGTNAALPPPLFNYLQVQFELAGRIKDSFVRSWNRYHDELGCELVESGLSHSTVPEDLDHNGYIFWIMTRGAEERKELQQFMAARGVVLNTHYSALHRSEFGRRFHKSAPELPNTDKAANCLLRLPLYCNMAEDDQSRVIDGIRLFYGR